MTTSPASLVKRIIFKGVPEFEIPENVPTLIVLDDSMDSAYSTKMSELFTKGSHHSNVSLVVIPQNLLHQSLSSRDICVNSKYIVVLRIRDTKHKLCTWLDNYTQKIFPGFIKHTWKTVNTHIHIFLDITQSINDLLRFRTKIFPGETCEVFASVQGNEPVKATTTHSPRTLGR